MAEKTLKSPLPGIFYRRPGPGTEAFVQEGDRVRAGDVLGLIEIMKTFNEIKAEHDGTVTRFLVESDDAVQAGQDLVVLDEG
jgi:acetyl-CoA carboxylase biotin carboxyl carrier protein